MDLKGHLILVEKNIPAGTEWAPSARALLFLQIREGGGFFLSNRPPWQVSEGSLVVLPPLHNGTFRASQLEPLRLAYFQIVLDLLTGILAPAEYKHLDHLLRQNDWLPQLHAADTALAGQFTALHGAARRGQHLLARCQMLHLTMSVLSAHLPAQLPSNHLELTAMSRFEELIRKLPEAELCYRSTAELAQLCGCSERHFRRLFRDHFGQTLVLRKTEMRLVKARELLSSTDAKIIDIALDSGFQHVGRFTQLFKKRYGVTPAHWRQRQRAAPAKPKTLAKLPS